MSNPPASNTNTRPRIALVDDHERQVLVVLRMGDPVRDQAGVSAEAA